MISTGYVKYVRFAVTALFSAGLSMFPPLAYAVCPATQTDLSTAITSAGAGGTVILACATATTIPFTTPITISQNVTLDASSSPAAITLDGQNTAQLFVVNSVSFTLKNVILTRGLGSDQGGAIHNNGGTVTISNSTLSVNAMTGSSNTGGGAISSLGGTLSIDGSTFSGNHADKTGTFGSPGGGAIFIQVGMATITNSTFTGNSTTNPVFTDSGGAIYNQGGTLRITGSTFSNNLGNFGGAIISQNGPVTIAESTFLSNGENFAQGGAIYTTNSALTILNSTFYQNHGNDSIEVQNASAALIGGSIIANTSGGPGGSTANPNCAAFGSTITTQGYNLDSATACGLTGTGDLQNANPLLGALGNYGGPTQTLALLTGSPAIDQIPSANPLCASPSTDQRGSPRPVAGGCDIGSYESSPFTLTTTILASSANPATSGQSVILTATVSPTPNGGTVAFNDAGVAITGCTAQALTAGQATCSVTYNVSGNHSLAAAYSGNADFNGSTSPTLNQTVNPVATTTGLNSSVNPSSFNQSVTFTATVSPSTAVGTVTFKDGTTSLGTGSLAGGAATFSTSSLSVGGHSITAVYGGNATFGASTSAAVSQTVNLAPTTTTLSSSANPSTSGQSVTFTAIVSPNAATGTVQFREGTTVLGSGTLVSGTANFSTSSLSAASHSITAVYGGDPGYSGSTSSTLNQTVNQASTTTALTSSATPATIGQPVTFTATVNPTPDGGTVAFADAGIAITGCTAQSVTAGKAACSVTYNASGSHAITAVYSGTANFLTSTSASLNQGVGTSATATGLTSSVSSSVYGQPVTFTATVSPGAATGTVTFRDGATSLGAGTLANGVAAFSTSSLGAGSHSITAVYGGDTIYGGSTSNALSESVSLASTTTTPSSSRNPSTYGAPVGITAAVAAVAPGGGIPTGTVQFSDGAASLGTATLNSAGIASINTQNLSVGTHLISALYNGGGNYRASVSSTLTEVVNTAPTSVKLSSSAKSSVVGQLVTFTASLSATSATGTVRFMYTSGGADVLLGTASLAGGTASFSTSSLAIGSYPMIARYDGDANFSPSSTSTVLSQTVGQAATNTALTSSPNPASVNQQVQLTATVTVAAPSAGTPTGFVQFKVGKFNWGQPVPVNASGVASTIFFSQGSGKDSLSAQYLGDTKFTGSISKSLTQVTQ